MRVLVIGDSCWDVFKYGNVYENLKSLNVECVLVSNKEEIFKTRYVDKASNHMIMRVDTGELQVSRVQSLNTMQLSSYEAIIISDYDKGFLHKDDIEYICSHNSNVFMDTKKILGDWCQSARFIKINHHEHEKSEEYILNNEWIQESLITTRGASGAEYRGKTLPVKAVEVKDLIGAGDSFLAGLVKQYLESGDIYKSIIFANECATKVVQQKGVNTCGAI